MRAGSLLLCLAVLMGPGVGGSLAAYRPGKVSLPTRVALVFALGCVIPAVLALALALPGALSPALFFSLLGIGTALLWYLATAKGRGVEHLSALRMEFRSDPVPLLLGLLVIAGIAAVRLTVSPLLHFSTSTSWRYWADGVEIADAGRIPHLVLQYGGALPAVVNKVLVSTLEAGATFAIGREPLPGMAAILWLSSVGLAAALWSLGHELGLRFTAALLPVLLVANRLFFNPEMTVDLNNLKAEILGRLVAFTALALAVRALRDRQWNDIALAGGLLGAAAAMHFVPVMITLLFLAFYSLARLLIHGDPLNLGIRAGSIVVVAAVVGGIFLFLPRGDIAVTGATRQVQNQDFDPTRYLNSGQLVSLGSGNRWYIPPRRALSIYVASATGVSTKSAVGPWLRIGLPLAGLSFAVVILLTFPLTLRPLGLTALGMGMSIVALIWLFSLRSRLYVPAFFGIRRLLDYSSLPLILLGLTLVERGVLMLAKLGVRATAGVIAVVLAASGLLITTAHAPGSAALQNRPMARAFTWIRTELPCDARILPDAHTEGIFEAEAGRVSVLEGATPYLRTGIRESVIRLLLEARRFFRDPAANRSFLEKEQVDYVAAVKRTGIGYHGPVATADPAKLATVHFLQLVYASPAMDLYQVIQKQRTGNFPLPEQFPGYRCLKSAVGT